MLKVKDFVDNNDNVFIELHLLEYPDDAFYELLWSGFLSEVPDVLQQLSVVREGWAIGAQCNILEVME